MPDLKYHLYIYATYGPPVRPGMVPWAGRSFIECSMSIDDEDGRIVDRAQEEVGRFWATHQGKPNLRMDTSLHVGPHHHFFPMREDPIDFFTPNMGDCVRSGLCSGMIGGVTVCTEGANPLASP